MTDMLIRRAKESDLPQITELWKEMMDYHLSLDERFELVPDSNEAYLEYLHSILDNYDYGVFVAETDRQLIGYTIGMILTNPTVFALMRYGFIAEMAVTGSQQRSGIGRRLWEHACRWFQRRGITVVQLNVSPLNEHGYRFWKQLGCNEFLHILWYNLTKDL